MKARYIDWKVKCSNNDVAIITTNITAIVFRVKFNLALIITEPFAETL